MRIGILGSLVVAGLAACAGPHEKAGERQDEAAANQAGQAYRSGGPAQRVGRAQDQADRASVESARAATEAAAADSENYRRQVEVGAVRLEQQARELRDSADARAERLKADAEGIAKR